MVRGAFYLIAKPRPYLRAAPLVLPLVSPLVLPLLRVKPDILAVP